MLVPTSGPLYGGQLHGIYNMLTHLIRFQYYSYSQHVAFTGCIHVHAALVIVLNRRVLLK